MIDLIKMKNPGEPFPAELVGTYTCPDDLIKSGFSYDEVSRLLDGKTVREVYWVQFQTGYMEKLAVDHAVDCHGAMDYNQIADTMGMSYKATEKTFSRALGKLKRSGQLREFLHKVKKLRELRERVIGGFSSGGIDFDVVVDTEILIDDQEVAE